MRTHAARLPFKFVLAFVFATLLVPFFMQKTLGAPATTGAKQAAKNLDAKQSKSSQSKPSKKVSVWTVAISNPWSKIVFRAVPDAIRIEGASGGCAVARAPDWTIMVFHLKDKRARIISISEWQESVKRPKSMRRYGKPTPVTLAGIPALSYSWPDTGLGSTNANADSLFQGHAVKKEKQFSFINVAKGTHGLTPEAIEIWRLMMEIPIAGVIPLENGKIFTTGQKSYTNRLLSQKKEMVPMSIFDSPQGYKFTNDALYTIFFGKKAEDMAEIFWSK